MKRKTLFLASCMFALLLLFGLPRAAPTQAAPLAATNAGPTLPNPILFVTQVPFPSDFTTINAVFGNHKGGMQDAPRGGDLWIRYPDGTLKNLTAAAGYGSSGLQGANAIAVRDPAVYWDGTKALFSMLIGAPTQQYQVKTYYWQLYEITGLGPNATPVITKVPNQPANYNNVSPTYGTDDQIIFTTDRARNGATHLSPQRDEYEEAPVVSGVWSLDPKTGDLKLLNHAPSGDFTPIVDSFGRVIFTQWDHLQRDQQADADANFGTGKNCASSWYGTGNYTDESANSPFNANNRTEVFPEPRGCRGDLLAGTNIAGHTFNQFTPWQMTEDGTDLETINHLGRHELNSYIPAALTDDPNLVYSGLVTRFNPNTIENMLQVREAPNTPGLYYGINAPEFGTHAAGQVVSISAPPTANPDHTLVNYITHKETASTSNAPTPNHSGLYRDPLPLSDGSVVVAHTSATQQDHNVGTTAQPASLYAFRLQLLTAGSNGFQVGGAFLTTGISKTISYWDPDTKVNFSGLLWELQPVEVRARTRPQRFAPAMPQPAQQVFTQAGVDPVQFKNYLAQNNLALIVSQNVTMRDDADKEQPFNLRVPGGVQTIGASGKIYDVARLQIFQGDQLRGLSGCCSSTPFPGRRVLAQPLHDPAALAANLANTNSPTDSVTIAPDGSLAAFVPARRAMSWQLTAPNGTPVVRERVWVTFQPGEVRVCGSCHGVNEFDQAGHTAPMNQPQALLKLLQAWKANNNGNSTPTSTPTSTPILTPTPITTPTPTPIMTATATKPPTTATAIPPTPTATATKPATATAPPNGAPPQIAGCNVFPANNIWNARVDTLPLDSSSATYVNTIGAGTGVHPDFGQGLWNGGPIGIPFVVVPGTQPKVPVTFQYADESDPSPYPIPTTAPIEGGPNSTGDRHILALDKDNCLLYETWSSYPQTDGSWKTGSGARFDLKTNALRPGTWTSADAAGLPILPGLVRYDEVASGEIKHAIRFTVPQTRKAFIWPARHFASSLTGTQYPPMGQRFRLRASFDVNSTAYNFAPEVKVILRAMQKYGIILADNGSAWYISGAPDERWNNDNLSKLGLVKGSDFEAVNEAGLMVDPNSGQVGGSGPTPTPLATATATPGVTSTPTKTPGITLTPSVTPSKTPTEGPTKTATPTPITTPTPIMTPTPATGISGKVTADGTGVALADIWVHLLRPSNTGWQVATTTKTESSGNYKFVNLTAGVYRLSFFDPRLTYKAELYDNVAKMDLAKNVTITTGVLTPNINAGLALAAAPLAQVRGSVAYANNPNTGQLTLVAWPQSQFTFQRTITCGDGAKASAVQLLVGAQSFPMNATSSDGAIYAVTLGTQGNFTAEQVYSLQTRWTCTAVTASSDGTTPASALSDTVGELHTLAQMPTNRVFDEQTGQPVAGARVYLYQAADWRPRISPEDTADATCESTASKPADAAWSQVAPVDIGTLVDDSLSSAAATQIDPLANPQWTSDDGRFAWNAPSGCWYVRVEADGYATTYSPVTGVTALTDLTVGLTPLRYLYLPVVTSNQ